MNDSKVNDLFDYNPIKTSQQQKSDYKKIRFARKALK